MILRTFAAALSLLALAAGCKGFESPFTALDERDDIASFPEAEEPPPPAPEEVTKGESGDWIGLTSGEWLRGEILRIRRDVVDFDSEGLDEQSIDLEDVRSLRSTSPLVLVTDQSRALRGHVVLEGEDLWVEGDGRVVRIPRSDLLAALTVHGAGAAEWSGGVTLGATVRSGNTQQNDQSAFAELRRETARTVWTSSYNGALSRAGNNETANNHRLRSTYDVSLTRRLFVTAPTVDVYRDRFQNLDLRLVAASTIGYEIVDDARHRWIASAGPAYQLIRSRETQPGEDDSDGSAAAVAFTRYEWDVTSDVELDLSYLITAALPFDDAYNHNFLMRIEVDLISDVTLDVVFVWDRVNEPIAGADGSLPEPDDFRTTIGLGWSF